MTAPVADTSRPGVVTAGDPHRTRIDGQLGGREHVLPLPGTRGAWGYLRLQREGQVHAAVVPGEVFVVERLDLGQVQAQRARGSAVGQQQVTRSFMPLPSRTMSCR